MRMRKYFNLKILKVCKLWCVGVYHLNLQDQDNALFSGIPLHTAPDMDPDRKLVLESSANSVGPRHRPTVPCAPAHLMAGPHGGCLGTRRVSAALGMDVAETRHRCRLLHSGPSQVRWHHLQGRWFIWTPICLRHLGVPVPSSL